MPVCNILRKDFDTYICNSDGKPIEFCGRVSIFYNPDVISDKEVEQAIKQGLYEWDNRILSTTPEKADAILGILKEKDREEECREI